MKLHLGCGQKYLEGYVNIDYPPDKHTVQDSACADKFADITRLKYKKESVDEIRLHHVFEHFPRAVACGLLVCWRSWLKLGGKLTIEVPDFERTAWSVLSPFSSHRAKTVALRHIFGSQEATWAVHYEGWTAKRMQKLLERLGFENITVKKNAWKNTYNFTITAFRTANPQNKMTAKKQVRDFLHEYLVDESASERKLIDQWLADYDALVKRCYGK